jgi:hypothetical protein
MDYTIITTNTQFELIETVKKLISQGWEPIGGVSVAMSNRSVLGTDPQFFQAMTKGK